MSTAQGTSTTATSGLWWRIITAVIACEIVGALAGWATRQSVKTWYPTLAKPWFTPPDGVFAPTWIALYAMMGVAAALVWARGIDRPTVRRALTWFGAQLALNAAWSAVFFGLQSIAGGLVVIAALWAALVGTVHHFAQCRRAAAWWLGPYLAWVTYAVALNLGVWWLN